MFDSILEDIKKILGVPTEYTVFDHDIVLHINSVFSTLHQLGIGPANGFYIVDGEQIWKDFIGDDPNYNAVKSYIFLRVKLLFDPPATSFVISAMQEQIKELESRLSMYRDEDPDKGLPVIDGGSSGPTPGDILDGGAPAHA